VTDFVAIERLPFQELLREAAHGVPIALENLAG